MPVRNSEFEPKIIVDLRADLGVMTEQTYELEGASGGLFLHLIIPRPLPICCSKIENARNVESDITINFLHHVPISCCHVILNLNFFLFCYSNWQKL
jgi:hypothetical protein